MYRASSEPKRLGDL